MSKTHSVLFVCYGNICRSPMGEAVFDHLAKQAGVKDKVPAIVCNSAGTGNHEAGSSIWNTAQKCLRKHGVHYEHIARQIRADDYRKFDLILGFDNDNIRNIERMKPADCKAEIRLVNYFNEKRKNKPIEDPWYPDTMEAFEKVYQDCHDSSLAILEKYK